MSKQSRSTIFLKSHLRTHAPPKIYRRPAEHLSPGEQFCGTTFVCQKELDLENDSSVEINNVNTGSLDNKLNKKDNAVKMLDNRLKGNFTRRLQGKA